MTRHAVANHADFRRSSAVHSGSDCASNSVSVQAKASFSTVSFNERKNINSYRKLNALALYSNTNFTRVLRLRTGRDILNSG